EEALQRVERQLGRFVAAVRQRGGGPRRQPRPRDAERSRRRLPLPAVAETPRLAVATERGGRKRLQRMADDEVVFRHYRIGVVLRGGIDEFAEQHRWFAHAAVARIVAEVAEVEHVLRGSEQLQEQEAVVLARGAVAAAAFVGAEF